VEGGLEKRLHVVGRHLHTGHQLGQRHSHREPVRTSVIALAPRVGGQIVPGQVERGPQLFGTAPGSVMYRYSLSSKSS